MSGGPAVVICQERSCRARFVFLNVHKQAGGLARMPVDYAEDPSGNIAVDAAWKLGRMLRKGETAAPGETRHVPHFATCTKSGRFRQREQPAAAAEPVAEPAAEPSATLFDE